MANAFDRVSHSFFIYVVKNFGLAIDFIDIIKACIQGPSISPLINGSPGRFFQRSIGLKQGFPLSPFLYIIMFDSLSRNLEHRNQSGFIIRIQFSRGVKSMNHYQFSDDTFFMGGASYILAIIFKFILDQFMEASGGILNNAKNNIYGWNTPTRNLQHIYQIFGVPFKSNWTHFKHLGLSISKHNLKVRIWYTTIDKMKKKI